MNTGFSVIKRLIRALPRTLGTPLPKLGTARGILCHVFFDQITPYGRKRSAALRSIDSLILGKRGVLTTKITESDIR